MSFLDNIPNNPEIDRFVSNSFDVVDRIHYILRKKGYSQRDLAKILGKSESEISKWMSGMHNFTLRTVASIEVKLNENILSVVEPKASCEPDFIYHSNSMYEHFGNNDVDCFECLPQNDLLYEDSNSNYNTLVFANN